MNDDERRTSLIQYANKGARAQPPVFVGRDAVVQDIANGRYLGAVHIHRQWVGRAMATIDASGSVWPGDAIRIIGETGPADEQRATALFDSLVERGFLQQRNPGLLYACPIPSLVRHAAVTAMRHSAAHTAAALGHIDDLERLVAAGADLDRRDALGRAPLHIAAECQWADVARLLLEAGADADTPDARGATPRMTWPAFEWPDGGEHRRKPQP